VGLLDPVLDPYRRRVRAYGQKRSPVWGKVRKQWLETHPNCAACGETKHFLKALEVHHIVPFHMDPSKELDPTNLVTLCQSKSHNCHLIFGHLLDFHCMNKDAVVDAEAYRAQVTARVCSGGGG
jgi:5-methylcytosine-specific restriction protein A